MKKKYFNNLIASVLVLSFILIPFFGVMPRAEAQSITGYASGLSVGIAALPQCRKVINSGIKSLFGGIGGLFSNNGPDRPDIAGDITLGNNDIILGDVSLGETAKTAANQITGIQVVLPGSTEDKLNDINANTKATRESTASLNENSSCIQSIGRLMIKMLLQKLTVSTVNWINSGFDGGPAFVQDPAKFFGDIAKNEILQFGIEINNPELFPFGKAWMQNTARAFNNKFQSNARYSLNELIQDTNPEYNAETFGQDFSQGGWDAWTALTEAPANTPLGFKIMADNELQKKLAGTVQSTAQNVRDALKEANGFLGDSRCSYPKGVTKQQEKEALDKGEPSPCTGGFKYVTPGNLIAKAATNAIDYPNNAYLNVQDLNDAVAAIADALLGQFSSTLMEKGFANLGNQGADGTLYYNSSIQNTGVTRTQTEKDFMPSQLSSSWLMANPNFNIRTDLTQALIDTQRTYSDKLKSQNKQLLSTTDGKDYKINKTTGISNAYGLMPAIYQLDYCIPGPHPGWENDSRRALDIAISKILPETESSLKDKDTEAVIATAKKVAVIGFMAAGAAIGSAVPIVGTLIGAAVGILVSFIVSIFGGSDDAYNVRAYYATVIFNFTGILPNFNLKNDKLALNLTSKSGLVIVLDTILNRYTDIMNKTYFSSSAMLPKVAKEAIINFNQTIGYKQMIKNNENKILSLKNIINTLGEIKNKVNELNTQLGTSQITKEKYEKDLKLQINAFGRLSASMVNGDDIANADNLLNQIIDKTKYIYTNLLKGPYGCEANLEKKQKSFTWNYSPSELNNRVGKPFYYIVPWNAFNVNSSKRATYPFHIIYDYNVLKKGDNIPDPWGSTYTNKMPDATLSLNSTPRIPIYDNNGNNNFGPGFLSFVFFGSDYDVLDSPDRLRIADIVPTGCETGSEYLFRSLGLVNNNVSGLVNNNVEVVESDTRSCHGDDWKFIGNMLSGPFESLIKIY